MEIEEKELFKQLKLGNKTCKEIIFQKNLHYVKTVVNSVFSNTPFEKEDLEQEGSIGLLFAVEHYDLEQNVKFSSYAIECIKNSIITYIVKNRKYKKHEFYNVRRDYETFEEWVEQIKSEEDMENDIVQVMMAQYILENYLILFSHEKQFMLRMSMGFNKERREYTGEEIGNLLGCTRKNVSKHNKETIEMIRMLLSIKSIKNVKSLQKHM